jgi:hypothetical protein
MARVDVGGTDVSEASVSEAGVEAGVSEAGGRGRTGRFRPSCLVVVPARDEAVSLPGCLSAVSTALDHALDGGFIDRAMVAVAAHRCIDDSASVAEHVLNRHPSIEHRVVRDSTSATVGEVRSALVAEAVSAWRLAENAHHTWVFSTDADSIVPTDWVEQLLSIARRERADAVAGLVDLVGWEADGAAQAAYAKLIEAGLSDTGHTHVYAANLAVRLDAYQAVGGFPSRPHGEEHGLLSALRESGRTVATPLHPRVQTSGRTPGRASAGLATLLADIADRTDAAAAEFTG